MIAILHNIRSLNNVGSIFRTADAAGIEKIYLCGITPKPVDEFGRSREQLIKVSLGAEKWIKWEHCKSTARLIDALKRDGYKIFVIEQSKRSIPYYDICYPVKRSSNRIVKREKEKEGVNNVALIVGNEVKGLPASILKRADKILEIPMRGAIIRRAHHPRRIGRGKESLNVAVAFGIVAFGLLNKKIYN